MINLFHLLSLVLFLVNFSGTPEPAAVAAKAPETKFEALLPSDREEDDEFIPWQWERRLTWDDFLCEPKRNTDAVASTSTALGIAYQIRDNKLTYQITCNFSKARSWGLVKTPYILAHEQGHFDITEIFARKLHQVLANYQLDRKSFKQDINTIYQTIVKAKEGFQMAYDKETDHSRNKTRQQEWLERIEIILEDTRPYAEYP